MKYLIASLLLGFAVQASEPLRVLRPLSEQESIGDCMIKEMRPNGDGIFLWLEKSDGDFRRLYIPGNAREKVKDETIRYSFKSYHRTGIPYGDSVVRTSLVFRNHKGIITGMKEVSYETFYNLSVARKTFSCREE